MLGPATFSISKQDGVTVIGLKSDVDHLSTHNVANLDEVREAVENADPPLFVVDLSRTTFLSSAFLMFLVQAWHLFETRDGARFAVGGLSSHSAQIIELMHLNRAWEVFDSADEAVRALSGRACQLNSD